MKPDRHHPTGKPGAERGGSHGSPSGRRSAGNRQGRLRSGETGGSTRCRLEYGHHLILPDATVAIGPQDHERDAVAGTMLPDALHHLGGAAHADPVDADDEIARLQAATRGGAVRLDLLDHRAGHLLQPGRLLDLGRNLAEADAKRPSREIGRGCRANPDQGKEEQG